MTKFQKQFSSMRKALTQLNVQLDAMECQVKPKTVVKKRKAIIKGRRPTTLYVRNFLKNADTYFMSHEIANHLRAGYPNLFGDLTCQEMKYRVASALKNLNRREKNILKITNSVDRRMYAYKD